ncbi:calcium and integrin-binding protein 1-like [Halichondria panicea]|uniref:calcium and integrin-binding protein 1-like n=1 Tax=Halichondria panicea TaxID=6063 RepID=UPI00312BBAFE
MGAKLATFRDDDMSGMLACTCLNRTEIYHTFKHFSALYELYTPSEGEQRSSIIDNGYINPEVTLPVQHILDNLPQMKTNPLSARILKVFTFGSEKEGFMNFLEFLEMISVFNPKTSIQVRTVYAFRVYDLDGDGIISRSDLDTLLDLLTSTSNVEEEDGPEDEMWTQTKQVTIDGVFKEVNKEVKADGLSSEDFSFALSRSPDFISTFSFRL